MANFVVVKLKCRKCGRTVNRAKNSCACDKPDVEKVEIPVFTKPGKRGARASSSP